jgi:hypothetical protein
MVLNYLTSSSTIALAKVSIYIGTDEDEPADKAPLPH